MPNEFLLEQLVACPGHKNDEHVSEPSFWVAKIHLFE